MHYLLLMAVEADSAVDATTAAHSALEPYEGEIYDWYEIGGRWGDVLAGGATLAYAADSDAFTAALDDADARRRVRFHEVRDRLAGAPVSVDQVLAQSTPGETVSVSRAADAAQYMTATNVNSAMELSRLLAADDLPADGYTTVGWLLLRLGKMATGLLSLDTVLWDAEYGEDTTTQVRARCADPATAARQWLVAVDLHY